MKRTLSVNCENDFKKLKINENLESEKRIGYLKWDEYFMLSAKLASERSKDPSRQVGCVIVSKLNRIIGSGYNGFCNGISDDILSWAKTSENTLNNKYLYVCHAELNAVLNCSGDTKDSTMYTTLYPCSECCKTIIQSGINKVIYASEPDWSKDTYIASKKMFSIVGVETTKYTGKTEVTLKI
jgi:dCMP deaminase